MKFKHSTLALALTLPLALGFSSAYAADGLVQKANQDKAQQQQHNQQRESGFVQTEQELQAAKAALLAER
ncbi:flagellar motor protein MotA, partial [Vibrio cholerae]|nr:flagellar motor protein MotA [Vibrio cholerae]